MDLEMLRERAEILRNVRSFFDRLNYLETDTPLLSPDLIPESCLEVFETRRLPPHGSRAEAKPYWLIPSPEIWMKRLIARHHTNLYQICKCFRNGESSGRRHSPEFTMLEYYTMEADYLDSLRLTEELFRVLLKAAERRGAPSPSAPRKLFPPFTRITMEEAFFRWAGFDLYKAASSPGAMEEEARRLGLDPPPGLSLEALYNLIFIHAVEPELKMETPVALIDYPAFVPCLAKKSPDGKSAERWELYAEGIELANCYSEETRAEEVRDFFEHERAEKERSAIVRHKVDEDYWKMFTADERAGDLRTASGGEFFPNGKEKKIASGEFFPKGEEFSKRKYFSRGKIFPQCSGVALGLDRLIMLLCGRNTIDGVLPFPMD